MTIEQLKHELNLINSNNEVKDWKEGLPQRKLEELEFHDRDRDVNLIEKLKEDSVSFDEYYGNKKYYNTTIDSVNYMKKWLKENVNGKVFLDYACGNGVTGIEAAKYGAALVIGLDISSVSVKNAQKSADEAGVGNLCSFIQGDCENTGLPDNSVDIVMCNGMLHHLDLSFAFPELRRILKPGGMLFAYEALDYNPFIKLYRNLTPKMRTNWEKEHILSLTDINFGKYFFNLKEIKYWHLSSFLSAAFIKIKPVYNFLFFILRNLDFLLSKIPFIRNLAWIFTFVFVKKEDEI